MSNKSAAPATRKLTLSRKVVRLLREPASDTPMNQGMSLTTLTDLCATVACTQACSQYTC